MGRKDAAGVQGPPVDNYRKQIGKQDWKKSKKEMKSVKSKADSKKNSTILQDAGLVVVSILSLVIVLYFGLYWSLNKDTDSPG